MLCAAVTTFAACGDDVDGESNSNSNSNERSHSNDDLNSGAKSVPASVSVQSCVALCELEMGCSGFADEFTLADCEDDCELFMTVTDCLFPYYPPACQNAMASLFNCLFEIDTCEEFESFSVDEQSMTVPDDAACVDVYDRYYDACLMMDITDFTDAEKAISDCEDEINALNSI